ncbi:hypothetical protein ACH4NV_13965 [Streptomyces althioticus]|uniref:hypothetical protein n=1 Tax=Streptomyces althioticus TaxID=83380 RepID=UPI0037BBD9B2
MTPGQGVASRTAHGAGRRPERLPVERVQVLGHRSRHDGECELYAAGDGLVAYLLRVLELGELGPGQLASNPAASACSRTAAGT